jgi:isopenicillin-N N-acyltransferase-like protein
MTLTRRQFIESMAVLGITGLAGCAGRDLLAFPELEASGPPGDLGLAHGRAFAEQIRFNLEFYQRWLSRSGAVPVPRLLELARAFAPVIEASFPELMEELDGIAIGAGMSGEEILLINARTDIAAIVDAEIARAEVPGCTAMALFGEPEGRRVVALGQNWDWDPVMADAPVVLRLRPDGAPPLVTLAEAGMLAKIGYNGSRLGVCLNFLSHTSDGQPGRLGVPIHCLLRAVLTCQSLDEAASTVEASPRCASANFLLAQAGPDGPRARDLEITPDAVATLSRTGDRLIHTNHFLAPTVAEGCTSGRGPSTMNRYRRAETIAEALEASEPDPVRRMEQVLVCREDLPYPISRDRNPDPSSSTLAGIIMDLTRDRLLLTAGPPHKSPWIERPGVG